MRKLSLLCANMHFKVQLKIMCGFSERELHTKKAAMLEEPICFVELKIVKASY